MSQPMSQPMSTPVKKQPTSPFVHNNPFDDGFALSVGIREDYRDKMVPMVFGSDGDVAEFEIGTVCSIKSWVQGDRHAQSYECVKEQCILRAVLGYYDDELVEIIPNIQQDGQYAVQLLDSWSKEMLKLAFHDHRVKCSHKSKYKNEQEYYNKALKVFKETRSIGGNDYRALTMVCPISSRPIMWKYSENGFVKDDTFQFDEHPQRNSEPLNYLPLKSIVIPRIKLIFHTNEARFGVMLKLCRDIRVVRVGHIPKVYAETAYIGKKRKHSE